MNIPENLLYTEEHEWVSYKSSDVIVGITDYAQSQLGDIIFVHSQKFLICIKSFVLMEKPIYFRK